jgi:hypothetical protein
MNEPECVVCGDVATCCHGSSCERHADIGVWQNRHAEGYEVAMQAEQIWLVAGRSGYYDSSQEWVVAAFPVQLMATKFLQRLNEAIADYGAHKFHFAYDREPIIRHFEELGFPEGTIPNGDLDGMRFMVYAVPFIGTAERLNSNGRLRTDPGDSSP